MKKLVIILAMLLGVVTVMTACVSNNNTGDNTKTGEPGRSPDTAATGEPIQSPDTAATEEPEIVVIDPYDVPLPDGYSSDEAYDIYDCEDDSLVYSYKDKTAVDFDNVCAFYKGKGFGVYSEASMGENLSMTLTMKSGMAHVYWLKEPGELSIVTSPSAAAMLPPSTPKVAEGDTKCTVAQVKNQEGMAYVVQLRDGSFIIIDGGNSSDAERLYKYLWSRYKGSDKPVIRAWLLTHSHDGHFGAFRAFAADSKYYDNLKVEYIIAAPMNKEIYAANLTDVDDNGYLAHLFPDDAAKFKGVKVVFAHTGMTFRFCNLNMELLCTPENVYKGTTKIEDSNNASIVSRLYDDSYKVLFPGDTMKLSANFMIDVYGDYLKSDMVQAAHHGMDDTPLAFYDTVRAPVIWYPCDDTAYNGGETYPFRDVRLAVKKAEYTKEILIAYCGNFSREWGYQVPEGAELMPGYTPPLKYELEVPMDFDGQRTSTVGIGRTSQGPENIYIKFKKWDCVCIGSYDLSDVGAIKFEVTGPTKDWIEDYPEYHTIRICKDFEGKEVIAEADMIETFGYGVEVLDQMIPLDTDYSRPVYIYLNCSTGHEFCIANLQFPYKD